MRRVVSVLFVVVALAGCESSSTIVQLNKAMEDTLFLGDTTSSSSPAPPASPPATAPTQATPPTLQGGA